MTRLVEVLVGLSALAGVATFLGVRTAIRKTLRSLGRKPERENSDGVVPFERSDVERRDQ